MVHLSNEQLLPLSQNTSHIRHITFLGYPDWGRSTTIANLISESKVIQDYPVRFTSTREDERPYIKLPQQLLYFQDKRVAPQSSIDKDNNNNNNIPKSSEYLISLVDPPEAAPYQEIVNYSRMIDGNPKKQQN